MKSEPIIEFEAVTHHKVFLSALNANHGNKTMPSRLIRWVDRLLLINFKLRHISGKKWDLPIFYRKNPSSGKTLPQSTYDNEFVVATINKIIDNLFVNTMCAKKNCKKNNTS